MLLDTTLDTPQSNVYQAVSNRIDLAEFAEQINSAAAVIAARLGREYSAILLTGAAARGEQTTDPEGRLASDLDFLVVLSQRHPASAILAERRCRTLLNGYEDEIPSGLRGAVSIGFASSSPKFWRLATPAMYELRMNARCLYGSSLVLDWPSIKDPKLLPDWEGVRLIANRLCEMFGALGVYHDNKNLGNSPDIAASALMLRYAAIKQVLACSEAALIFCGEYRSTYRERFAAHLRVAQLFTGAQNAFINDAYSAKLGASNSIFEFDPDLLARDAAALAIHTLALVGASTPAGIARLLKSTTRTAPGPATDFLFFARQSLKGNLVPMRRAISSVYGDVLGLAHKIVALELQYLTRSSKQYLHKTVMGASLYTRYKGTPQVVGTI